MQSTPQHVGTMYTIGLDMQCRKCVCTVKLVEVLDTPTATGFDCVTRSRGVSVYGRLSDLHATRADAARMLNDA